MKESLLKAIEVIGGGYEAVGALYDPPISTQAISKWVKKGRAPSERCLILQEATKAKGNEVTVHELRPDVFGAPSPSITPHNNAA